MFARPIRACVRPATLLGEHSKEVNRKRKREEDVWRAKLAVKKAVWQVHHAISGKQISDETAATAMRLLQGEADRPAHIRMQVAAPEPPPRPLENWYRAPAPMHEGLQICAPPLFLHANLFIPEIEHADLGLVGTLGILRIPKRERWGPQGFKGNPTGESAFGGIHVAFMECTPYACKAQIPK